MTELIDFPSITACPFCGSDQVSVSFSATMQSHDPAHRFVECELCSACGPSFPINGDDETATAQAIGGWNARSLAA